MINILNVDCMGYMIGVEDKYFDLAIVDPPYGHGNGAIQNGNSKRRGSNLKQYNNSAPPGREYFHELKRVSKNQIIWGANHFANIFDSSSSGWLVWDKQINGDYADCELAYSSFNVACKKFTYLWNGFQQGRAGAKPIKKIHVSQKPVPLYDWLLHTFSKPGQKILDTHLGSGSSAIAAYYFGVGEFVGCEIDKEYYCAALKRVQDETKQVDAFACETLLQV